MLVEVGSIDVLDRMMSRRMEREVALCVEFCFRCLYFLLYRCRYEVDGIRSESRKNVCRFVYLVCASSTFEHMWSQTSGLCVEYSGFMVRYLCFLLLTRDSITLRHLNYLLIS
jgi:hypothetical protein